MATFMSVYSKWSPEPSQCGVKVNKIQILLEQICPEIETQLKPHLRGLSGPLVSSYLPQNWVFETEIESCTLFVDTEGNARVLMNSGPDRDVTVQWKHNSLLALLESRSVGSVQSGDYPNIIAHTHKGRTAFIMLRKRFGL